MDREKRKYPRFNVANFPELHGKMDARKEDKRLVTLGLGGCGFYGPEPDPLLQPVRRVFCRFEINCDSIKKTIEVQGNLIYLKDIEIGSKVGYFYGVEFLELHQPLIVPIIEKLKELEREGKINAA